MVLTQGPGNLGTGTRWGFSGVAAGEAVNAAAVLGGRPVGSLRVSAADPRERHRGVSHHSLTAYGAGGADALRHRGAGLRGRARAGGSGRAGGPGRALLGRRHDLVPVDLTGLLSLLVETPIRLSSMGRGVRDDPGYFLAAAAAGRHAADVSPLRMSDPVERLNSSSDKSGKVRGYCGAWVNSRSTTITRVSWGPTDGVGLPSG